MEDSTHDHKIHIREIDYLNEDDIQLSSHLLLQYMQKWSLIRDTNINNTHHYPGQILYYDISRITHIIDSARYAKHRIFIAYVDNEPAGIAGITHSGENVHLFVKPKYYGYGIGRALIEKRVEEGSWFATVHKENTRIKDLLQSCGFVKTHSYRNIETYVISSMIEKITR